ncbi:MAG: 2OG-Fe(II) oxygenase [Alphaproteobacteria bacterium]|nr:2OG-Fe(II) oxygenase [Alphaproteobacteria bacterium]
MNSHPVTLGDRPCAFHQVDGKTTGAHVRGVSPQLSAAIAAAHAQQWTHALDLVARAATEGDAEAGAQLATLAGEPGANDWERLRAAIDPTLLVAAPQAERLSDGATIGASRGFATPAMCAWMMRRAQSRLEPSMVNDSATGQMRQHPMRTAYTCAFGPPDRDLVIAVLQARAAALTNVPVAMHEAPNVISYEPGQQFGLHVDFVDPKNPMFRRELEVLGQRVTTVVTYLNEDFDDAPTHFPALKLNVRGGVGDAIVWSNVISDGSPDVHTVHAGMPPTRGRKWVLSQWLRNKPQPYNL